MYQPIRLSRAAKARAAAEAALDQFLAHRREMNPNVQSDLLIEKRLHNTAVAAERRARRLEALEAAVMAGQQVAR